MMDISKFTEFVAREKVVRNPHTEVFLTLCDKNVSFSSGASRSLPVSHVKIMVNEADRQVLLLESEDGVPFMKDSRNRIVWGRRNDAVRMIDEMVPVEKKTSKSVRINGELVDVNGKRGILFTCK